MQVQNVQDDISNWPRSLTAREKKKEKLQVLLQDAESLEKSNTSLRQECYRLEAEKRYLVKMLMDRSQAEAAEQAQAQAQNYNGQTLGQTEEQIFINNLDFNLQFWSGLIIYIYTSTSIITID